MKRFFTLFTSAVLGLALHACASTTGDQSPVEGVGAVEEGLSKCAGGTLGDGNYCSTTCKCDLGEGDCDGYGECNNGLLCVGKGMQFYGAPGNVCAPAHCNSKKMDGDETQVDCGGSCGTLCPDQCLSVPPNGQVGHCTTPCPCPDNQGDCAGTGTACTSGFCKVDAGASFGFAATIDVCLPAHCNNGVADSGETGVDCGGPCVACVAGDVQSAAFGGTIRDHGQKVVYDNQGNFIVVGYFSGTANFGGANLTSAGSSDIYVAKYNSLGAHQWSKRFGGSGPDGDQGVVVGVDNARNVVVAGNFWDTVDFGGGPLASAGSTDMFLVRFDQNGTHLLSRRYGGAGADRVNALSVAPVAGESFVAGAFEGSAAFGNTTLTSAGLSDAVIFKVGATGTVSWRKQFGAAGNEFVHAIAVDSSGNVFVGGSFSGSVDFGTGLKTSVNESVDAYALKTNSAGTVQWVTTYGSKNVEQTFGVAVDVLKRPTFVGRFTNSVDFGGGLRTAAGSADIFIVALTDTGAYRWDSTAGSTGLDRAAHVATDASNNVITVGEFTGTINFGAGAISSAAGLGGAFVVKHNQNGGAVFSAGYGTGGSAGAVGVAVKTGQLIVTGDMTGSINFGSGAINSTGETDMFWAKYSN
jgi:hypothetical protein